MSSSAGDEDVFTCSHCETTNGAILFIGSSGVCNFSDSGEFIGCLCPEGFSGVDDWITYGDSCHVNEKVQYALQLTALVVSSIATVVTFICTIYLLIQWAVKPNMSLSASNKRRSKAFTELNKPGSRNSKNLSVVQNNDSSKQLKHNSKDLESSRKRSQIPGRKRREFRRVKYRKLLSFGMVMLFMVANSGYVYYGAFMISGATRDNARDKVSKGASIVLDLVTEMGVAAMLTSLYFWFWSVYLTLPNLRKYGNLLQVHSFLVTFPYFVPRLLFVVGLLCNVSFLIIAIIPIIVPNSRQAAEVAHWICLIVFLIVPLAMYDTLVRSVEKIMRLTKESVTRNRNVSDSPAETTTISAELEAVETSLRTAYMLRFLFYPPVVGAIILPAISLGLGSRNAYFFFNIAIVLASGFNMLVALIVVRQTEGGLAPKIKRKASKRLIVNTDIEHSM